MNNRKNKGQASDDECENAFLTCFLPALAVFVLGIAIFALLGWDKVKSWEEYREWKEGMQERYNVRIVDFNDGNYYESEVDAWLNRDGETFKASLRCFPKHEECKFFDINGEELPR